MTTPEPLDEAELVATGTERQVLEAMLDYQRSAIRHKVADLSEEDARRRLVPSATTLAGLVKHLVAVERAWYQRVLAGRSEEEIGGNSRGDASSWQLAASETVADLLAEYDRVCAESRTLAAQFPLEHTVSHRRLGQVSLRWIHVHMIEETARHAGHADILREQIDGVTGD